MDHRVDCRERAGLSRPEAEPFELACSLEDRTLRIRIGGRLDSSSVPALVEAWETENGALEADAAVIDCRDLRYISSAGLRVFMMMYRALEEKGGFSLVNVNAEVRAVLEMTGFDRFLGREGSRMLNEAIRINRLMLRNRIVMPPMATGKAAAGAPDDGLTAYYGERAKGTALIIVEHEYVSPEGKAHGGQLSMAEDALIPAYRKLTEAVHRQGAAIFAQLSHAGAQARDTGLPAISPSGIPVREGGPASREMTAEDIGRVTECFLAAALRAKEAGFDGVEIHSAHGYLLNQFYSPLTNRRKDAYTGETMEGRTRLHGEILRALRRALGSDYPLAVRFGACDYAEGGSVIGDVARAAGIFAEAGADLLDISGGLNGFTVQGRTEPGWFSELSIAAKEGTGIPVLLTGGITGPEDAERLLRENAADLIGIGRAMLKDPAWAVKALDGASDAPGEAG